MARKRVDKQTKKSEQKTAQTQSVEHLHASTLALLHSYTLARPNAYTPALVLILLPTLLLWSVTFGGKTLAPVDLLLVMSPWRHFAAERFPEFHAVKAPLLDVVQQYFPWRKFYAESLRQGELPLWNPFMFCGTSFVGNGMSAIFYPLNLLFVAMPVETAFGWVVWLHLILAGIFMFGFLRQSVSPIAALTGAIAFQLCGFFVAWLAYLPLICTAIWLPAALWSFEKGHGARDTGHGLIFTILAGFALGMALLAGHPQVGFYVLWAFGVYFVLSVIRDWGLGTGDWKRSLAFGLLAIFCGIAVGAPQLLPLMEMAKISFRSEAEALIAAAANRLPFDQFVRLFIPSFFGDWRSGTHLIWDFAKFNFVERTGYPSVIAFLLAMVSAFSCWKLVRQEPRPSDLQPQLSARQEPHLPNEPVPRPSSPVPSSVPRPSSLVLFIAGFVFAAIGLLAASVPIVHRFMALGLPGIQAFVGISRSLFLFDFGIAILCAFGIEFLARQEPYPSNNPVARPSSLVTPSILRPSSLVTSSVLRLPLLVPLLSLAFALVFMAVCVSYGVTVHAGTAFHPLLSNFTISQIYRWLAFTAVGTFVIFFAIRFHAYTLPPSNAETPASLHSSMAARSHAPTSTRLQPQPLARLHADTLARLHALTLYALPFLVAADLLAFAWSQHPEAEKGMAFFETPSIRWLKEHLGSQRFIAVGTDAVRHWTPSNTLMAYGLRDGQGSDSLMTMRIFRFLQTWDANSPLHRAFAVRNFDSPLLDLMAVKYIVASEPLSADERKSLRLVHSGDLWVYENPNALLRVFVVPKWRWAKSPEDALQQIKAKDFDPRKTVVLEEVWDKGSGTEKADLQNLRLSTFVPNSFHFIERTNTLKVEVELAQPAALVVADGVYLGWKAFGKQDEKQGTEDGRTRERKTRDEETRDEKAKRSEKTKSEKTKDKSARYKKWRSLTVLTANYAFRAVLLPEGRWQVTWVYFPSSVIVGSFLCLTVIGMTIAAIVGIFRGK
ncbi:MAG: glycosyltransferase family 39 protein [Armatimonadetes bacterium]|nr:glycosyltransferase family 39 protein [Armatimonadota bacterium]MDW8027725.1 hypothetical protein [Armatimonadota bacterium]